MIIHCPSCQTQFFMSAPALGDGRMLRCSKCKHEWHQTPEMNVEDDIPLSVMPRAQEMDDEEAVSFDPKAFLLTLRDEKPRYFAAICAALPFVGLAVLFLLLSLGRGVTYPSLPDGVSAEGWRIEVASDGTAQLYGLLVNETTQDQPMPVISLQDETGAVLGVGDADASIIPALSEFAVTLPVTGYSETVQGVRIYVDGFKQEQADPAAVTESQAPDTHDDTDQDHHSADVNPATPAPGGETHHQDEHHSPQQAH